MAIAFSSSAPISAQWWVGSRGVDDVLGVLGDDAEPAAQVVVDIGCQVGDSVVEHLLPQRGLLQRVLGFLLAPLELGLQPVAGIRDR